MDKQFNKRIFGVKHLFKVLDDLIISVSTMIRNKKNKTISDSFIERIMLAVTEVNGCRMCTYYHTGEALKNGLKQEEIKELLGGDQSKVPKEEAVAIIFAQHYADTGVNPEVEAWNRVVETYGQEKASIILATIRSIMFGNLFGIAIDTFLLRLKGKSVQESTIGKELGVILGFLPILLFLMIKNVIAGILGLNKKRKLSPIS